MLALAIALTGRGLMSALRHARNLRAAARNARERYVFVGMVEEFELSVLALELLLPRLVQLLQPL